MESPIFETDNTIAHKLQFIINLHMYTPFENINVRYLKCDKISQFMLYRSLFIPDNNFAIYIYNITHNIAYIKQDDCIHVIIINDRKFEKYLRCSIQEIIMECFIYWQLNTFNIRISSLIIDEIFTSENDDLILPYPSNNNINNAIRKLLLSDNLAVEIQQRDNGQYYFLESKHFIIRNMNELYIMSMNKYKCTRPVLINKINQYDLNKVPIDFIIKKLNHERPKYCIMLDLIS